MNKKLKLFLIALLIIVAVGFATFQYVMHGGARDVATEQAAFTVESKAVIAEFTTDAQAATKKYLNKTIAITGTVSDSKEKIVTLDETISCVMQGTEKVEKGQKVTLKGRITGYDDLLGEIKMDQCSINK